MFKLLSEYTSLEKLSLFLLTIFVLKFTSALIRLIYYNAIAPFLNTHIDFRSTGKWAVVTGSTDGIGKAYAEQLAKMGMAIVLISRTESKLEHTAKYIRNTYGVETKIIIADFTEEGSALYSRITKELDGMDIGVLINNAGQCYPHPEYFLNFTRDDPVLDNIVKCNILSVINMCRIVMPGMVKKRRGVIVNIGSASAPCPCPLLTVYGSSKKFVEKFSEDLGTEYKRFGIIIQCVMPGYVVTKMSKIEKPSWIAPTPEKYVQSALTTTGVEALTTGYFPHTLLINLILFMKSISPSGTSKVMMIGMQKYRNKGLKKKL
ncbi:very-long-chain 3-oxoacyl-CoA reductase-like [Adelges cooleyi]|uniref:very-long-chain 3-oxoacyl-CoA reductase-like n=1 Tax=Adelges cooleyi TaxID=133065 RepID=UPI00217FC0C7|nr:very-long-chain 3-oxoacyl-CoA reductase-like [Adelges cooleyi]